MDRILANDFEVKCCAWGRGRCRRMDVYKYGIIFKFLVEVVADRNIMSVWGEAGYWIVCGAGNLGRLTYKTYFRLEDENRKSEKSNVFICHATKNKKKSVTKHLAKTLLKLFKLNVNHCTKFKNTVFAAHLILWYQCVFSLNLKV